MRSLRGVDPAEVGLQRAVDEIGEGSGQLDAGRTAADDGDGHQAGALGLVGGEFGVFEIGQDRAADVLGIGEGFEAEAVRRPLVVAEIPGPRAGGEQQVVEGIAGAGTPGGGLRGGVDAGDLIHQHGDVFRLGEDLADRAGDVRRGQRGGGDLIEQRLEEVVVRPVHQRHVEAVVVGKASGAFQSGEAAADDEKFAG